MSDHAVASLNLRRRGHDNDHARVMRLLDEVPAWARDFLTADEDPSWTAHTGRFEACRTALADGAPSTDGEPGYDFPPRSTRPRADTMTEGAP